MSQHDLTINNAAGSAVRADLNLALQALGSTSIGSSAPATLQTGQIWIDNSATPWVVKVYDGAQHITIGSVNASTNAFSLAVAQGGTGAATATAGFDALAPMTAEGDLMYGGSSGTVTRLGKGSNDEVLTLSSGVPTWAAAAGGGGGGGWYTNIAVIEFGADYFNGGSDGSVPNLTGGSGSWTYTIPATELIVMVIAGGGSSHSATQGGTCSFGSHVSATGGQGSTAYAGNSYVQAIGGLGASGDINLRGAMGGNSSSTYVTGNPINQAPMFGGTTYGHGGGGGSTHTGWGAAGGYAQKRLTSLTIGATVTVTVPNEISGGGYDNTYKSHMGGRGVCIIMY